MECCLPFGFATAPFIFNLFAEGLNWLLTAYLPVVSIVHYLDDFIAVFPPSVGDVSQAIAEFNTYRFCSKFLAFKIARVNEISYPSTLYSYV
jgi:hypothetical protein